MKVMTMSHLKVRAVLSLAGIFLAIAAPAHAQRLYGTNAFVNSCASTVPPNFGGCGLFYLNPVTGAIVDGRDITLAGFTVTGATSVTVDPTTHEVYAILKVSADTSRRLAKLDVRTGVGTMVGNLGDRFASITFRGGQLYGATGNGAAVPETLYLIDKTTASKTFARALGAGADGETLAYNPNDDMIYHWSGSSAAVIFEKVSPDPPYTITSITPNGGGGEVFGAVWNPATDRFLVHDISSVMASWSTAGVRSDAQAATTQDVRGLALLLPGPNAALARTLAPNSLSQAGIGTGVETWYRAELFANRSYQVSAWLVDHEQGVDGPALSVSLFSDAGGTVPALGVTGGSGALEGSPNQAGDANPVTAIIQPPTTGVYRIRVQRVSGATFHTANVMLRETTLSSPWTSRGAGFEGFIELHNNTNAAVSLTLRAYNSAGVVQGAGLTFSLQPNATEFRTASQVGVPAGAFAGIVATHDGASGAVSGNITTLNGANGLSFDSPFGPRDTGVMTSPVR